MNQDRRKRLGKILEALNISDLLQELESVKDEEQEAFDNLPESLQSGEKGDAMEEAVNAIESLVDALQAVEEAISEVEAVI